MMKIQKNMNPNIFVLISSVVFFTYFTLIHGTITPCNQTPYPELCEPLATNDTKPTLHKTLRLAMTTAKRAIRVISAMDVSMFEQSVRTVHADCIQLYEYSAHHIKKCLKSSHPTDVQTWLSGALTDVQTCKDGFADFKLTFYSKYFPQILIRNFTKLLRNALALNKALILHSSKAKKHPEWVQTSDRRILQHSKGSNADLVVAQDGSGHHRTINEALQEVSKLKSRTKRFTIHVKAGVYAEYVEITSNMPNLTFVGDGMDATIVTGNKNMADGVDTYDSATFVVEGDRFIARGMMFENSAGPHKEAAVALRATADFAIFFECSFKGYQDTLYVHEGRQFYRNCHIYGTIDFIFGDASAFLQNCDIYVRKPLSGQKNIITAQGRIDPGENTGIVIHNSRVIPAPDLAPVIGSVKTYLGRPWRPYSRTVFIKCFLDHLIDPEGWLPWDGNYALKTLYYGEYMNAGPGSSIHGRVNWPGYHRSMSLTAVEEFSVRKFWQMEVSWIAETGVPFESLI